MPTTSGNCFAAGHTGKPQEMFLDTLAPTSWAWRLSACFVFAFAVLGPSTGCADEGKDAAGIPKLTGQETVDVIYLQWVDPDTGAPPPSIFCRANPEAKPEVYKILGEQELELYHGNAWNVLGYIGEDEDVDILERAARAKYKGVLASQQAQAVSAILNAIGTMALRGNVKAKTLLERMASLAYWKDVHFTWVGQDIAARIPDRGGHYRTVGAVMSAYARCAKEEELRRLAQKAIDEAGDERAGEYLRAWVLPIGDMLTVAQAQRAAETMRLTDARLKQVLAMARRERARVRGLVGNEPKEKPKGNVSRTTDTRSADMAAEKAITGSQAEKLKAIVGEATAQFDEITTAICKGASPQDVADRLLDNGKPLDRKKMADLKEEFEQDWQKEREAVAALEKQEPNRSDFSVSCVSVYRCAQMPKGEREVKGTVSEEVTVSFRLEGTAAIGKRFLPQPYYDTVAEDGTLIVLMKKIDGKWYWNPFGW